MRDVVVVAALVVAFAALVTVHLAIVAALAKRLHVGVAFLALVVPPLAPYWAARNRMMTLAGVWILLGAVYVVARIFASI